VKKRLNMLPPFWGKPTSNSKIVHISCEKEIQKERMIKRGNIYSVVLYPREVVNSRGQGEGTYVKATMTSGGKGQSVIKSPQGFLHFKFFIFSSKLCLDLILTSTCDVVLLLSTNRMIWCEGGFVSGDFICGCLILGALIARGINPRSIDSIGH